MQAMTHNDFYICPMPRIALDVKNCYNW